MLIFNDKPSYKHEDILIKNPMDIVVQSTQNNINTKSKLLVKTIKKHPRFVYTTPMYNEFYIPDNQ